VTLWFIVLFAFSLLQKLTLAKLAANNMVNMLMNMKVGHGPNKENEKIN